MQQCPSGLSSDIFIIYVVVLLLVLLALRAVCWVVRNNRTQRTTAEKLTDIEIISAGDGPERDTQAKFTLKIRTDPRHATQLVEMLVGRVCRLEGAVPDNPLAPLTSVTLPTVVSPTDMMASPAPASLPVPTENMLKNSLSQPTPHRCPCPRQEVPIHTTSTLLTDHSHQSSFPQMRRKKMNLNMRMMFLSNPASPINPIHLERAVSDPVKQS
uniref:Uncharacterized protein n=1 Tax=Salmo trutta TaxID=8032 RepID=A0A674BHD5_SALTR